MAHFSPLQRILVICVLLFSLSLEAKHIIWDIGGVLCDVKRSNFTQKIAGSIKGMIKLAFHRFWEGRDLKAATFNYLEQEFGFQKPKHKNFACTADEFVAPQIMCDWLANCDLTAETAQFISSADFITLACSRINDSPHLTSKRERKLVKRLITCMFDPEILAHSMYPIEGVLPLLEELAPHHSFHILSNYTADGFEALVAQPHTASIFDYFERQTATVHQPSVQNALISGYCNTIKPYASIYELLKKQLIACDARFSDTKFLLNEAVFIDNSIENVVAARLAGITALWLSNGDYAKLRQELQDLGYIC